MRTRLIKGRQNCGFFMALYGSIDGRFCRYSQTHEKVKELEAIHTDVRMLCVHGIEIDQCLLCRKLRQFVRAIGHNYPTQSPRLQESTK